MTHRFPLVKLDGVPAASILPKEIPKYAGMLVKDVLKNEYFHSRACNQNSVNSNTPGRGRPTQ